MLVLQCVVAVLVVAESCCSLVAVCFGCSVLLCSVLVMQCLVVAVCCCSVCVCCCSELLQCTCAAQKPTMPQKPRIEDEGAFSTLVMPHALPLFPGRETERAGEGEREREKEKERERARARELERSRDRFSLPIICGGFD